MTETAATAPVESTPCPHCHGKGTESVCVAWSDGLGMSTATCGLCEGAKTFPCRPEHLASHLASRLRAQQARTAEVKAQLERLRTDAMLYLVTSGKMPGVATNPEGTPIAPGFPGASTYPETWQKALVDQLKPWATARQAEREAMVLRDHEGGFHETEVPRWTCAATNDRIICPACQASGGPRYKKEN